MNFSSPPLPPHARTLRVLRGIAIRNLAIHSSSSLSSSSSSSSSLSNKEIVNSNDQNRSTSQTDSASSLLPSPCCTLHAVIITTASTSSTTSTTNNNNESNVSNISTSQQQQQTTTLTIIPPSSLLDSRVSLDNQHTDDSNDDATPTTTITLAESLDCAFLVGRTLPSTLNPTWCFDDDSVPRECANAVALVVRVWNRGRLVLSQLVPLARLAYVGDSFEALSISAPNSFVVALRDGLYMLPHHLFGMQTHLQQLQQQLTVRQQQRAKREMLDSCTLSQLVEIEQRVVSLAGATREIDKMAAEAEQTLFGDDAAPQLTLSSSSSSSSSLLNNNEVVATNASNDELCEKRRQYAVLLAQRQWLAVREARLRERVRERRQAVNTRRAAVAERRDALLQSTVRLSGRRDAVVEARVSLARDVESLKRARRTQHEMAAKLRLLQWSLTSRLSSVFVLTPASDGSDSLCINRLRLPQSHALTDTDDETVAAALAAVGQCVTLAARYLDVPLRYPLMLVGSRSMISDLIAAENAASPNFPLYARGVDRTRFEYAVFLLNLNIEQLLQSQNLQSITLRHTLPNLQQLLLATAKWSSNPSSSSSSSSLNISSISSPVHHQSSSSSSLTLSLSASSTVITTTTTTPTPPPPKTNNANSSSNSSSSLTSASPIRHAN